MAGGRLLLGVARVSVPVAPLLGTGAASAVGSISGLPPGMTQSEGEKARPRKRVCLRGHRGVSGPSSQSRGTPPLGDPVAEDPGRSQPAGATNQQNYGVSSLCLAVL